MKIYVFCYFCQRETQGKFNWSLKMKNSASLIINQRLFRGVSCGALGAWFFLSLKCVCIKASEEINVAFTFSTTTTSTTTTSTVMTSPFLREMKSLRRRRGKLFLLFTFFAKRKTIANKLLFKCLHLRTDSLIDYDRHF